ncbi:MAG: DEAD/DEAH box helicase [Myxococcales bacterium]|nr:DEAD/DEAH box helicase [Myxococcales bacterium]
MPFSLLGLNAALAEAALAMGYRTPTPVQARAVPLILAGRDVLVSAPTGSGKTVAFALPLLQQLATERAAAASETRVLVVVPTRELAVQITHAIEALGRHLAPRPSVIALFGGVSRNVQMMLLRGGKELVVATPGRLLDLVEQNALKLSGVRSLVLDEADRLLSLGFADELAAVLALLPERRQSLLFSATIPAGVEQLAASLLRDPVRLTITDAVLGGAPEEATLEFTANGIEQRAIELDADRRGAVLCHLMRLHAWARVLIFVASRRDVDGVVSELRRAGISAAGLHGNLSQGGRTRALEEFKAEHIRALVATDLAARGLDIVGLPAVINYDLPRSAIDYVHRIGRTGRAGRGGVALSFVTALTSAHLGLIERRNRIAIPRERIDGFEPAHSESPRGDAMGGQKGKRMSKKDKLRAAAERAAAPVATFSNASTAPRDGDKDGDRD